MTAQARQLWWIRTDLRTHDNSALEQAAARGPVVAVFLISPAQWKQHDDAACKVDFWLRNVRELRASLAALNIPLLVREAPLWRDAPSVLQQVCAEYEIHAVHVNAEYGVNEQQRDANCAHLLQSSGVMWHSYCDALFFEPGSVLTRSGGYFQVFSQFRKVCYARLAEAVPSLRTMPPVQITLPIASDAIPETLADFPPPNAALQQHWPTGETAAHHRLETFVETQLPWYATQRDFPAEPGTSYLSPYLAAGVLSPRQCLHAALRINQGEFASGNAGVVCWISELLWREFYKHILVGYPRVSMHRAFKPETEAVAWRDAPADLRAWQEGRTGIPIVDAAMRQLLETGWMHNRLRMISAMFLTKNLLIDWRLGERWFMQHLIDGDLAANNGGWQWSASTGTDAAPYFRIFNPISQSEKFDPEGRFLRHWLPELSALNRHEIHNPAAAGGLFGRADWPKPIVDLAKSRERALEAFQAIKT